MKRNLTRVAGWLLVAVLGVAGGAYLSSSGQLANILPGRAAPTTETPTSITTLQGNTVAYTQTVEVRPAASVIGQVSAAGNIALSSQHYVVLNVAGEVNTVQVKVGDAVKAGDVLVQLDTSDLERSLRRAQLSVNASKNSLAQLQKPVDANDLAQAQAELTSAQKKLADAKQPASETEIAAAKASVASGWSHYNELKAPKTPAEITKLEASLRKAEVSKQEAQRAYDKVKWRNDVGMTSEAANLQSATIDYESAKADYEVSSKGADQSDLQSAISSARTAEEQLNDLLAKPDTADIASAEAQVASAQKSLADVKAGTDKLEVEATQIKLEQSLVDLEEAQTNLAQAQIVAPLSGTLMSLDAEVGQQLQSGNTLAVIADTAALELPVSVAEVDIDQVTLGQQADITIDALLGKQFTGEVVRVAPASEGTSGVVNYQVTIRLTDTDLSGVRPDMTAVASLVNSQASSGWLVPTTALGQQAGHDAVLVLRNGQPTAVNVTPGLAQGEWTVVQADALQSGDQVVGDVASYVKSDGDTGGGFGPPRRQG